MGGIAYTPYLAAQATSQAPESTTGSGVSSKSSPEKITGTIKKEIVDLLKENGIPSDVNVFLKAADRFLTNSTSLFSSSIFGGDDDYTISDLIRIQQLVNDVKYNNGLRDEAVKQITKESAGSEVAITDSGYIYAYNEDGNIVKLTPQEYANDRDSYRALTNNMLLAVREHDPNLAFQTGILNDLSNTIGLPTITKQLRDIITAFGSDKVGGYTTKDAAVKRGMQELLAAGPDGYYQFTRKEQLRDVNRALSYLYESLPENAKNLIRAKTAVEGGDPTNPADTYDLLLKALYEHTSREVYVNFDKPATEYDPYKTGRPGGSGDVYDKLTQNNYLQQIGNKRLYRTSAAIVPKASQIFETGAMNVPVYNVGSPIDRQRDVLGKMSLSEFRTKAEATKAGDMSSITFGNRIINSSEMDLIMYDGSSEINIAMLPYRHDARTGQLTPDFSKLVSFNEIQRFLTEHPGASELEIAQHAQSKGIDWNSLNYDRQSNSIIVRDTMPFITFTGCVGRDAFDVSDDMKPYLEHLSSSAGRQIIGAYNNMLQFGVIDPKKSDKSIRRISSFLNIGSRKAEPNDMYRGNVYIPMENAARAMLLSGIGEFVPRSEMTDFAARVTAREYEAEQARILREQDPNYYLIAHNIGKFN